MDTLERRESLERILKESTNPIKGASLAYDLNVSRQVIVQDIAILRAKGINIVATSKGYSILRQNNIERNIKTLVCKHKGYTSIEKELSIIIDMGGKILDVIVVHPVYGEIRCTLMINSRYDLEKFIEKVRTSKAEPLASLTKGEHIHTIEVPSDEVYEIIVSKLDDIDFLVKD